MAVVRSGALCLRSVREGHALEAGKREEGVSKLTVTSGCGEGTDQPKCGELSACRLTARQASCGHRFERQWHEAQLPDLHVCCYLGEVHRARDNWPQD